MTGTFHIVLAMKPLDGNFVQNALRHGVAGINVDGTRIGVNDDDPNHRPGLDEYTGSANSMFGNNNKRRGRLPSGRWPANVILLDEEAARRLDTQSGALTSGKITKQYKQGARFDVGKVEHGGNLDDGNCYGDTGGASRFFYQVKEPES